MTETGPTYQGDSVTAVVVPPLRRIAKNKDAQPVTMTGRWFDAITGLMTINERHSDKLTITSHPVEDGAAITDHAYMEPAELQLQMMATNSSAASSGSEQYVEGVYQALQTLQQKRTTFSVQTGKRLYNNMLIETLAVTTDEKSEHALMLQIGLRAIIIVQTQIALLGDNSVQATPAKTGNVSSNGTKQALISTLEVPASPDADAPAPPPKPQTPVDYLG